MKLQISYLNIFRGILKKSHLLSQKYQDFALVADLSRQSIWPFNKQLFTHLSSFYLRNIDPTSAVLVLEDFLRQASLQKFLYYQY